MGRKGIAEAKVSLLWQERYTEAYCADLLVSWKLAKKASAVVCSKFLSTKAFSWRARHMSSMVLSIISSLAGLNLLSICLAHTAPREMHSGTSSLQHQ